MDAVIRVPDTQVIHSHGLAFGALGTLVNKVADTCNYENEGDWDGYFEYEDFDVGEC